LYFGSGSQGTQAGLMVGAYLLRSPMTIYGVAVEHPQQELQTKAAGLASQTAALLGLDTEFSTDDAKIDDAFVGADYADPTEAGVEAVQLLARTEALFLDHVYTGKAMAALISHVREGRFSPADSVVFLHSGGGPSIFANRQ